MNILLLLLSSPQTYRDTNGMPGALAKLRTSEEFSGKISHFWLHKSDNLLGFS